MNERANFERKEKEYKKIKRKIANSLNSKDFIHLFNTEGKQSRHVNWNATGSFYNGMSFYVTQFTLLLLIITRQNEKDIYLYITAFVIVVTSI